MVLSGCQQVYSIMYALNPCDQPEIQIELQETIRQEITNVSTSRLKSIIENEHVIIDSQHLYRTLAPVKLKVENVDKLDKLRESKTTVCSARLTIEIPSKLMTDADVSRALNRESNVLESAALSKLDFKNNQLSGEINFTVNKTTKKPTVRLENALNITNFTQKILIDSQLKMPRIKQMNLEKKKAQDLLNSEKQLKNDYQMILIAEAQLNLDRANDNLNQIWNKSSNKIKQKIQYEQDLWSKKRELECKLNSEGADNPEVFILNCHTNMALSRISELEQKIYSLS